MTCKDIIVAYLKTNGYDGLFSEYGECGCALDDLMPCGEYGRDCQPGYRVPCPRECGDHNFHIQAEKP